MPSANTGSTSRWKLISFFLAGILVPLAAGAVPWLLDNIWSGNSLKFTVDGPISTKGTVAYAVNIQNKGKITQEDIEVWLPLHLGSYSKKPQVFVESSLPPKKVDEKEDKRIMIFDSLRPKESLRISVFAISDIVFVSFYDFEDMRIVSRNVVGVQEKQSEELSILYQVSTWMLITLLIIIIAYGLYYEYVMPVEKKEKNLLDAIDKLKKKK